MHTVSNFNARMQPVRDLIRQKNLDAFVIRRNPNLAWAIAGRAHVPTTIDMACFDLIITQDSAEAITNVIEAPRLQAEEFPPEITIKTVPWSQGRDALLPTGSKVGSDQVGGERLDMSAEIEIIRGSLISSDILRFKEICSDAALALGNAVKEVSASDREIDVAARVTSALWRSNLEIAFLGVAGQDRVKRFRHPLPTASLVGDRLCVSICAKRKGLIASITRMATFAPLEQSATDEYRSLFQVEAAMFEATVVGRAFSEPIHAAISAYAAHGFDPDEWQRHHQGGPTGFLPRDWPANQSSSRLIADNQPIAWNPTGKGWKAEDTILATQSGVQILTNDPTWPSFEVNGRTRPFLLQR